MEVSIREEPMSALDEHARIPIAFRVESILDARPAEKGLGGIVLAVRRVEVPFRKDYDACPDEGPSTWARRFDLSNWGLLAAFAEGRRVGGAVVAFRTAGVDMLEGRDDLAVLWDIRVSTESRGQGVGAALFHAAEAWARGRGARQLKVETQNVNVAACRFYARQGCVLGAIHRFAYPELPQEIQMLWYKDLQAAP